MWLLLAPTRLEAPFLRGEPFSFLGRMGLKGKGFVFLETGVGKVNAALALAVWASRHPVERALLFGVAGAYPEAGLGLGEVALVAEEVEADLNPVGFPALVLKGKPLYNRFPLDSALTGELSRRLGLPLRVGLTRDRPSESPHEALGLASRWQAHLENMEGAAFARACLALGVPGAELRAVSNPAGVRDRAFWRLEEAVAALERAVLALL